MLVFGHRLCRVFTKSPPKKCENISFSLSLLLCDAMLKQTNRLTSEVISLLIVRFCNRLFIATMTITYTNINCFKNCRRTLFYFITHQQTLLYYDGTFQCFCKYRRTLFKMNNSHASN